MAAMSLGLFSSFLPAETVRFGKAPAKLVPVMLCAFRSSAISAAAKRSAGTKAREPTGIMKPRRVSPEMQSFLGGASEIPRTQALKEIWAHIKQHNLQDPANKKVIICDEKLKTIFGGRDQVGFLEIAGLISPHFIK